MILRRALLASWLALLVAAIGCGKKGPPLAPLRPVPAAVDKLTVTRQGDAVRLELTAPAKNADGTSPADLARLEIYGLTMDPADAEISLDQFVKAATLVGTVAVKPPPPRAEEGAPPPPPDPRPGQGDAVSVEETLTAAAQTPVTLKAPAPSSAPRTLAALTPDLGPMRTYLAVGYTRHGRRSNPSPRVQVSLRPAPSPPGGVTLTYTETAFTVAWTPMPADPWAPIWPLLGSARGVNVYEVKSDGAPSVRPLNPTPVTADRFELPVGEVGVPRCFAVRAVEAEHGQTVEGALSGPACQTPRDTFPPAAPAGLAAVGGPGVISLIWDANHEPDLAGYLVLRGEGPDGALRAITPAPVHETTYRDTDVRPGVRYVYAVVAVDRATPPNISAQSTRVEETVR